MYLSFTSFTSRHPPPFHHRSRSPLPTTSNHSTMPSGAEAGLINCTIAGDATLPPDLCMISDLIWDSDLQRPCETSSARCNCVDEGSGPGCQDGSCMNFATYGTCSASYSGWYSGLLCSCRHYMCICYTLHTVSTPTCSQHTNTAKYTYNATKIIIPTHS